MPTIPNNPIPIPLKSDTLNVIGTEISDTFIADSNSKGNFTIDGRNGLDTVDYSQLGQDVTIGQGTITDRGRQAAIAKGGGFGTDTITNVETFVGATGKTNTIDGSAVVDNTSFSVDLSSNQLSFDKLFGQGESFGVNVAGFNQVIGTKNNDTIKGNDGDNILSGGAGNDTFLGTKGKDTYKGDGGSNTLDYSQLGSQVNLSIIIANQPDGSISERILGDKGPLIGSGRGAFYRDGNDNIIGINKFVGVPGENNSVGIFGPNNGTVNIDLSKNSLTIENLPGGPQVFEIVNFKNATGTERSDTIVGNDAGNILSGDYGDDILTGGNGNDILSGGVGNDILTGGNGNNLLRGDNGSDILLGGNGDDILDGGDSFGRAEVDRLTGGGGSNTFVLGSGFYTYYLGNGANDYAFITDFDLTKDRIQLANNKDAISLKFDKGSGTIDLFSKQSGSKDLIAKVKLANPLTFGDKSTTKGIGEAKTLILGNSSTFAETTLASATIGGDSSSIEAMFAKSIVS